MVDETCTCEHGWVRVAPAYAIGKPPGAVNTVYPCRRCQPTTFHRWAGGHYAAGHDTHSCVDCIEANRGRRAQTPGRRSLITEPRPDPVPASTGRRDLDEGDF